MNLFFFFFLCPRFPSASFSKSWQLWMVLFLPEHFVSLQDVIIRLNWTKKSLSSWKIGLMYMNQKMIFFYATVTEFPRIWFRPDWGVFLSSNNYCKMYWGQKIWKKCFFGRCLYNVRWFLAIILFLFLPRSVFWKNG